MCSLSMYTKTSSYMCTRILHVHDPSPYHTRTCTFTCTRLHFTCSCPKKTSPPYSDRPLPSHSSHLPLPHPLTLNVPATVQYNYVTPYLSFTTPPIASPMSPHPAPLTQRTCCRPIHARLYLLQVQVLVYQFILCKVWLLQRSMGHQHPSLNNNWHNLCTSYEISRVHSLFRTIPRFLLPLLPLLLYLSPTLLPSPFSPLLFSLPPFSPLPLSCPPFSPNTDPAVHLSNYMEVAAGTYV